MEKFEDIDSDVRLLIVRFLDGPIGDADLIRLQKWIDESSENEDVFNKIRQSWIESGSLNLYDENQAWKRVDYHIEQFEKTVRIRRWTRILGYAAAVVMLLCGSIYLLRKPVVNDEPILSELTENGIVPGSKRAILVLESNEKVELRGEMDMIQGEHAKITNKGNTLLYADDKTDQTREVFNTLITPRGGEYSIVLADGTKVWINAESELRYPVRFVGNERVVYLKGEAYFDVKKQDGKPFIVCSGESKIRVLGTEFNVRNYRDEEIAATLVRGSVIVTDARNNERRLVPGQQARFTKDGIEVNMVETDLYTGWKDGYFVYRETPLDEIMTELSRWYDFTYFYQNKKVVNAVLTARLRKFESAERIFKILEETGEFKFEQKGKTVVIKSVQ